jgi:sn-glycerol 3-phosphate transport system permease protein
MATDTAPRTRFRGADLGWYLLLTALSVLILFPIWMTLVRALSNPSKSLFQKKPSLLPVDVQWGAFVQAFTEGNLGRPLLWSLLVTVVIVSAQTVTSILAAYAFAFLKFPFKRTLFVIIVATLLLPIEVTLLTNYKTFQGLGWATPDQSGLNAFGALTIPFVATALGIFLIRQGFLGVPKELRDAAALDGFGHIGFLFKIAVPVTRPIIASFILISFLGAYNQYVWPRQVVLNESNQTIQLTLRAVASQRLDQLNLPFAAAIIAAIPVLILLVVFQRQLVRGLTAGAVKG